MRTSVSLLAISLACLPTLVFALDYTDVRNRYADAPFPGHGAVAINILSNLGVVSGYPDRTFRPDAPLNRAEAVKIVTLLTVSGSSVFGKNCFPDVHTSDWYDRYVCQEKAAGILQGYKDGLFHPERMITYAQALKLLTIAYHYPLTHERGDAWFSPFLRSAENQGVALEENPSPDSRLTRAQMARLAAAFRADHDHELALYRQQELSWNSSGSSAPVTSGSSSMSSLASQNSSSSMAGVSSSLGASSQPPASSAAISQSSQSRVTSSADRSLSPTQPSSSARTLFLALGEKSDSIATATFSEKSSFGVYIVKVLLTAKVVSIDSLLLLDAQGTVVAKLLRDSFDPHGMSWIGTVPTDQPFTILPNVNTTVGVVAQLKNKQQGGVAGETVQVNSLSFVAEDSQNQATSELLLNHSNPYPQFETR